MAPRSMAVGLGGAADVALAVNTMRPRIVDGFVATSRTSLMSLPFTVISVVALSTPVGPNSRSM